MVAELGDDGLGLAADGVGEGVGLGIQRAGQREVLPDHDAVPVAQVEERVILVNVAAPAAEHVAVQVADHRKDGREMAGVAGVEARPAAPSWSRLHEDRRIVDQEEELAGTFGCGDIGAAEAGGSDADARGLRSEDSAGGIEKLNGRIIERLRSVAAGEPEIDVLEAASRRGRE